ncbi:UDP-2,3-diacylglucosamine diphosphatase LpxI [Pelagicoccus sp. SDUM812003]|uniref:LpxI family protein n=1 Tax=Pelagicoccus sp. SDUM812003 TaxID=3041267 RepID=UPI00280EACE4|nr:UDP-2,3-diacylglucosamine diphosphatase LpxI [Pelagicoccus sp. SDUM812003]MDQ8202941.1 UDP-2,3-diacylglucosamine diphosphatase LpxI [Pelagicoccus sp. SDUM812003]
MSQFLPPDFDRTATVGLIAGRGVYPRLIAEKALAAGIDMRLIAFEGEAAQETIDVFPEDKRQIINVGRVGSWLKALRTFGCKYTIAAGQVKPGKLFRDLKPDFKATALLVKLKRKNAHTIFGAIANELAANGQTALDARCFLDDQMATPGLMTKAYEKVEDTYIQHGIEIATEMARLDIGQGVVVRKGTVLAVEAFEGTDPMLKRAGGFKADQLVFVKTVKRQQDYRFDVPVFGLRTLEIMAEHRIGTAVLKAGSVIMVEKEKILATAAKKKIQLIGF